MTDLVVPRPSDRVNADGAKRAMRDESDGTYSEVERGRLEAWDATSGIWVKAQVDHATGELKVS